MIKFIRRLLSRPAPPHVFDIGPDSPETWSAGDHALCVEDPSGWRTMEGEISVNPPVLNETCLVVAVYLSEGVQMLILAGRAGQGWTARNFRKIRPDAHEDCEPEFIALLKRSKRRVSA